MLGTSRYESLGSSRSSYCLPYGVMSSSTSGRTSDKTKLHDNDVAVPGVWARILIVAKISGGRAHAHLDSNGLRS